MFYRCIGVMATCLVVQFASAQVAFADCQRGDCWGAIAYGPNNVWAKAINHRSRDDASSVAHAECNGRCSHTLTFHNECGAYASGRGDGMGWGASRNEDDAIGKAIKECLSVTNNCTLRISACTTR
jgi:hypothetical protein